MENLLVMRKKRVFVIVPEKASAGFVPNQSAKKRRFPAGFQPDSPKESRLPAFPNPLKIV
jgi:hypothetical protein